MPENDSPEMHQARVKRRGRYAALVKTLPSVVSVAEKVSVLAIVNQAQYFKFKES